MRILVGIASAAALLAIVAAPAASQAKVSDKLVVYNAQGHMVKRKVIYEDNELAGFQKINGVLFNANEFGDPTILLEANGAISDVVGIHQSNATGAMAFGFKSDTDTSSPKLNGWGSGGQRLIEEPVWYDVTKYLDTSATSGQVGWTARFWSDVETVPVPEPASWILMISGLAAIGAGLRSSRKNVATAEAA
jgi:hypothetical protein